MIKKKISVNLGDIKKDAPYLLYGFDVSLAFVNWPDAIPGRPVSRISGIRIPLAVSGTTDVTLHFSPHIAMDGEIFFKNKKLLKFKLSKSKNKSVKFSIPYIKGSNTADLKIIAEREADKPYWFGNSFYIHKIQIEGNSISPFTLQKSTDSAKYNIYWGDLHVHSNYSLCNPKASGSIKENIKYARDKAGHDFIALSDHAEHFNDKTWQSAVKEAAAFNKKNKFAVIPGYEWTSELYGHRNVYFKNKGILIDAVDFKTHRPSDLWKKLKKKFAPRTALTIGHHPAARSHLLDWAEHDPDLDRLVEIFQVRKSQEEFLAEEYAAAKKRQFSDSDPGLEPGATVKDALAKGYKLGFTGGSDAHEKMAGSSGLTAVFAKKLTPDSIFDSLYERKCYATTGVKIKLKFFANGYPMGSELNRNLYTMAAEFPITLKAEIEGTDIIQSVDFLANGVIVNTQKPHKKKCTVSWEMPLPATPVKLKTGNVNFFWLMNFDRYFYIRLKQKDGNCAWSSPVWFNLKRLHPDDK